jgi:hypothetical protein
MAGDYLLVWGEQDEDGFMEAELLDGRLVPTLATRRLYIIEEHGRVHGGGAAGWKVSSNFSHQEAIYYI